MVLASLRSWLNNKVRRGGSSRPPRKRSFQPRLEGLERREVLSAIASVIDGSGTLVTFVQTANGIWERHGSNGWQHIVSGFVDAESLSAGTDANGAATLLFTSTQPQAPSFDSFGTPWPNYDSPHLYEWHDSRQAVIDLAPPETLQSFQAGQNGLIVGTGVDHKVFLFHEEIPGQPVNFRRIASDARSATIGTEADGTPMIDVLFLNGNVSEWTPANPKDPLATGSEGLSQILSGVQSIDAGPWGNSFLVGQDGTLRRFSTQDNTLSDSLVAFTLGGVTLVGTGVDDANAASVVVNNSGQVWELSGVHGWEHIFDKQFDDQDGAHNNNIVGGFYTFYGPSGSVLQHDDRTGFIQTIGTIDSAGNVSLPDSTSTPLTSTPPNSSTNQPPTGSTVSNQQSGDLWGTPDQYVYVDNERRLIVNAPVGGGNSITIRQDTVVPSFVQVLAGNAGTVHAISFDSASFDSIWINPGAGTNSVLLEYEPANIATHVTASGIDTIQAGDLGNPLSNFTGGVFITGNGATRLTLNDQGTSEGFLARPHPTFTVTAGNVEYLDQVDILDPNTGQVQQTDSYPASINYSGLSSLAIQGGNSGNEFDVRGTAAGTPVDISTGSGTNRTIVGGDGTSNGPINLFAASGPVQTNTLDSVQGKVTVHAGGQDTLILNDQATSNYSSTDSSGDSFSYHPLPQFTFNAGQVLRSDWVSWGLTLGNRASAGLTNYSTEVDYDGTLASLEVHGGSSGNQFLVHSTSSTTPVEIYTGSGTNQTVVGGDGSSVSAYGYDGGFYQTNTLDTIRGQVTVHGGGQDSLVLNDQAAANFSDGNGNSYHAHPQFTITAGKVTRISSVSWSMSLGSSAVGGLDFYQANIAYEGSINSVAIHGGSSGNEFDVRGTSAATPVEIDTGTGTNKTIVGGDGTSNGPINLFAASGPLQTNTLDSVQGKVTVHAGGQDTLILNDQATANYSSTNSSGGSFNYHPLPQFTINAGQVLRSDWVSWGLTLGNRASAGLTNYSTEVDYDGTVTSLEVHGGSSGNTFNVQGTAASTPVTIDAGSGPDTINIGGTTAETLDSILGKVTVNGQGSKTTLNYNDQNTTASNYYWYYVNAGSLDRVQWTYTASGTTYGPPVASVSYTGIGTLNVHAHNAAAGAGASYFSVTGATQGTTTNVYGGGGINEFIVAGNDYTLNAFQGPLFLHGSGSGYPNNNVVSIYDIFDRKPQRFLLTAGATSEAGMVQRFDPASNQPDMAPINYDGINSYAVLSTANSYSASASHNDTVDVQGNAADLWTILAVGTGDTVNVGTPAHTMAGISGDLRIQAYAGQTPTVNLNDSGDTVGRSIDLASEGDGSGYRITGLLAPGSTGRGRIWLLDPAEKVSLKAGTGNNVFRVHDSSGAPAITIDGGSGPANWLDYSGYGSGVKVNLQTGTATGLAGVSRIQNVVGSLFNDSLTGAASGSILIGLAGNDTLQGGAGRNILIGGLGRSTLVGGSNQDIFISGSTVYDTQVSNTGSVSHAINYSALDALMAEWGRTDESEATRERNLTYGGGRNGSWTLNRSVHNGQPATVFDNPIRDVVIASRANGWYL